MDPGISVGTVRCTNVKQFPVEAVRFTYELTKTLKWLNLLISDTGGPRNLQAVCRGANVHQILVDAIRFTHEITNKTMDIHEHAEFRHVRTPQFPWGLFAARMLKKYIVKTLGFTGEITK